MEIIWNSNEPDGNDLKKAASLMEMMIEDVRT